MASSPLPAEEEGEREGTELRWGFDGHSHGPARFRTIVGHNWWGGARKEGGTGSGLLHTRVLVLISVVGVVL